jgi:hypothetical protein
MGNQQGSQRGASRMQSAASSQPQAMFTPQLTRTESPSLEEIFGTAGTVPVMFRWTHGGQRVAITGTFNNWASAGIPMVRSGEEFYQVVEVPKTVHQYKFLVDGEWKFSLDQPVLQDLAGNVNNVVDIQHYEKYEPVALRDPLEVTEEEAEWGQETLEPVQAEPPSAPPLLVRLPLMGLGKKFDETQKILSMSPADVPSVNIPLFAVCGHVVHDASVSFRGLNSDSVVTAAYARFAQKYTCTVLVSVNNSPKADGLLRLYGLSSGTPPEGHIPKGLASDVQKSIPALPPAVKEKTAHALLQALSISGIRETNTPQNSGIVKRTNSSGSEGHRTRTLDLSTFTD